MIRDAVAKLGSMGRFPLYSQDVSDQTFALYDSLLDSIAPPVSDEESVVLCSLLNEDDFYDLAHSVLRLVETASGWPVASALREASPFWRDVLEQRARNSFRGTWEDLRLNGNEFRPPP